MKYQSIALTTLSLLAACGTSQAVIVYHDEFDGDFLINNNYVGGGLISDTYLDLADPFIDEGVLTSNQNPVQGFKVAYLHTENQFDLSGGFTLTVDFQTAASSSFASFTSSFGIVDEITASGTDLGNLNAFMQTDADLNAVGFSATTRNGFQGLNSDTTGGALTSASTALNSAIDLGTRQTFTLTVNADGSADFDLDGTSASLGAGTFSDLFTNSADGEYFFAAYTQGNSGMNIYEITIDAVPEPSSAALLGLGGLALILRRRR
ncbi:PEP-CTERM sorting domain-containing protein [Verrucomicrobiaceae bacterium 5K15]|uniref:PEP-CTERM sorting domain-containing protein n=1 Tax=Oceaniferula flava TaxID=2800421 RepID=A0AAE2SDU8_9BACT|nr:PEP-CTERM sorting domain-containing protein [Oceaniferula flavus]MBK1855592.1 PEP-CTERM sorting domain-containing protein [Oceaniferula flavus]MBM1136898.1 PEP-CTERM sorting domain-containing protein [Oceaniferula flavus]